WAGAADFLRTLETLHDTDRATASSPSGMAPRAAALLGAHPDGICRGAAKHDRPRRRAARAGSDRSQSRRPPTLRHRKLGNLRLARDESHGYGPAGTRAHVLSGARERPIRPG